MITTCAQTLSSSISISEILYYQMKHNNNFFLFLKKKKKRKRIIIENCDLTFVEPASLQAQHEGATTGFFSSSSSFPYSSTILYDEKKSVFL